MVQKRSLNDEVEPGCIGHICGAIRSGESNIEAAIRETEEETGKKPSDLILIQQGVNGYNRYRHLVTGQVQGETNADSPEVEWVDFFPLDELNAQYKSGANLFVHEFFEDAELAIKALGL